MNRLEVPKWPFPPMHLCHLNKMRHNSASIHADTLYPGAELNSKKALKPHQSVTSIGSCFHQLQGIVQIK